MDTQRLWNFPNLQTSVGGSNILAHPQPNAELWITSNASAFAIGGVIHHDGLRPLAYFSKELSPAECKYAAYDRQLLAICVTIKHYQHILEGQTFVIYTDHKPTFAFQEKLDKCSPRQHHRSVSTDICYIVVSENVVAHPFTHRRNQVLTQLRRVSVRSAN